MEQLVEQMKVVLASAFSLYLKSHGFHWNVTGPNFSEYHSFFGSFYNSVHDSVDDIAEHIRALGVYAPASYGRFAQLTHIQDEQAIPAAIDMMAKLALDNDTLIQEYQAAHVLAEKYAENGLLNFIEGQLDFHQKMAWQLKAFGA
jgi:starvation-inducible DNA-binding protein